MSLHSFNHPNKNNEDLSIAEGRIAWQGLRFRESRFSDYTARSIVWETGDIVGPWEEICCSLGRLLLLAVLWTRPVKTILDDICYRGK